MIRLNCCSQGQRKCGVMVLIVGGAYQGKLDYAKNQFPDVEWIDGRDCEEEEIFSCGGIHHFHIYVKRYMKRNIEQQIIIRNPQIVIVSSEIGYGIVPVDRFEREYRELTGRICTRLAGEARQVHRVVCGIGTVIKG